MIREALLHLPGIGPEKEKRLRRLGIASWDQLAERIHEAFPPSAQPRVLAALEESMTAHARGDLGYFATRLAPRDRWRVLAEHFPRASYFDIETDGTSRDARITLIACLHRGAVHTYMRGENLSGFAALLDEIDLLVSFNGASFDVPFVLRHFGLPELPCPHIDLRWICRHQQVRGGLKAIERQTGVDRPADLEGVDGLEAVHLWNLWERRRLPLAREKLLRYCAADVLSLPLIAARLFQGMNLDFVYDFSANPWALLETPQSTIPL